MDERLGVDDVLGAVSTVFRAHSVNPVSKPASFEIGGGVAVTLSHTLFI